MGGREAAERRTLAMRSSVNWALLGLVIQRPSYGYELVQRFERTFEDALELSSPSQVYTALDNLARRGLIEEVAPPGERDPARQPKPHYRATQAGVDGYCDWLLSQIGDERRRYRLLAQLLALLGRNVALEIVNRCEQACLKEASALLGAPATRVETSDVQHALVERLIAEEDRLRLGARLDWLRYARREIEALPAA
jgi:DNA-binding PadR family transcriptional regulator